MPDLPTGLAPDTADPFAATGVLDLFLPTALSSAERSDTISELVEGRTRLSNVIQIVFGSNAAEINISLSATEERAGFEVSIPVSPELTEALNTLAQAEENAVEEIDFRVSGAVIGSVSLSAGFVVWMLRAGSLMASLMTSKPMWSDFDPLPIFDESGSDEDEQFFPKS